MSANDNMDFVAAAAERKTTAELRGWAGLGVIALALAGSPALILALSRVPGSEALIDWPQDLFQRALTVHVILSLVVWYLAAFGGLCLMACLSLPGRGTAMARAGRVGLAVCWAAIPLLILPIFVFRGEPHLNNYVPVTTDPLFLVGLGMVLLGPLLAGFRLFANMLSLNARVDPAVFGISVAAFAYLIALGCFGLAYGRLSGLEASPHVSEELFWGGGHVLQFMNVAILLTAWFLLGSGWMERAPLNANLFRLAMALILIAVVPAPLIEVLLNGGRETFSDMKYLLGIPAILVVVGIAFRINGKALPWRDPIFLSLALSVGLFGFGGVLGFFVDGQDTRTPSHYHGVLGAVNVALMGLYYGLLLPLMGRPIPFAKRHLWQLWLYGSGQALQCLGLFLAGGYGAPRKVAGEEQGLEHLGAVSGMWLNGIGALIAVIGGVMFILFAGRALLRRAEP